VSTDPYAAPTANLENLADTAPIPTKVMSAKGRLSVLSYLAQSLILMLAAFGIIAVLAGIGAAMTGLSMDSLGTAESVDFSNPILIILMVIAVVVYIALTVISFLLMIKRLHDRNHSGWWSLALMIGMAIPFVNLVAIVALLYVMFFPGQKTGNRFGGRRETKGWEKVLGIIYLVVIVGGIVAMVGLGGAAIFMGASSY